jgi:uridine kinase
VDRNEVNVAEYNFDHPNAIDFDLAYHTLLALIEGNSQVEIPRYSFTEYARLKEPAFVGPANIIFFEGLMAFHDQRIRELLTYKIFINCDGTRQSTQTTSDSAGASSETRLSAGGA